MTVGRWRPRTAAPSPRTRASSWRTAARPASSSPPTANRAASTLAGMATTTPTVAEVCAQAKAASRVLATLPSAVRDAALEAMAEALERRALEILEANARDMEAGRESGLTAALLDRLELTEDRLAGI